MANNIKQMVDQIFKLRQEVEKTVIKVIKNAESNLKGKIIFSSSQSYNDNNYYTHVELCEIGGMLIKMERSDWGSLDVVKVNKIIKDLKSSGADVSLTDLESLEGEEKIAHYCVKKRVSAELFFETVDSLLALEGLDLPGDSVKFIDYF